MQLEINHKFHSCSVYGVDFHPTVPWLLTGISDGTVNIYNLESGAVIHTFEVTYMYVLCVKFIVRMECFVAGTDDGQLHVFNYNTHEKIAAFEAHTASVNCLAIHPTAPIVLTGSNDMCIKAWDWAKHWRNIQTYKGHGSFVTSLTFNPKDPNSFVSASLDGTVKMWSIASPIPRFTISAHDWGVTYVDFYPGADKSYLITASGDKTIKVWDYLSRTCIRTMEGHTDFISFAVFHPNLPFVISGSHDFSIKVWSSMTYQNKHTFSYDLGWACCLALRKDTNEVAVGFGEAVVTLELDHQPTLSMDHSGKLVYAHNHKAFSANLHTIDTTIITSSLDGAQVSLQKQDLGSTEIFASSLLHSPNGRSVAVIGDGEYIIYATSGWRKESSGTGTSFAWAPDSNTYAALDSNGNLKIGKNVKEKSSGLNKMKGAWGIGKHTKKSSTGFIEMKDAGRFVMDALYTGPVLGARAPGDVIFWDWETGEIVRRINVEAKNIYWSTNGTHVAITSSNVFYIFYFNCDAYQAKLAENGSLLGDEGIPESFILLATVSDTIRTAQWHGDYLVYTTPTQLRYLINHGRPESTLDDQDQERKRERESYTIASSTDKKLYLLGYIPAHGKVYVADEDMKVYGFGFSSTMVDFQAAVLKGDIGGAEDLLENVPKEQIDNVVKFLEDLGFKDFATSIANEGSDGIRRHKAELYQQCAALTMELMVIKTASTIISDLRDDKAQVMVEFLSKIVFDEDSFTQRERKRTLHLLSKLAKSAQVFPQSLELEGVQCNLMIPVTAGGYGFIYKGEHEGSSVCVKAVQVDSRGIDRTKLRAHASELIIWAHIFHPNVLQFLGIYPSKEEVPRVCIVSPWMDNGDLLQYLNKVLDAPRKPIVRDIISGLQYLHGFDIIHADLKAKNVLVSETGRAMLADFGISRLSMTHTTALSNAVGSLYWTAPELLLDDELPSRESDIWAFACTCYEILTGTAPFNQHHSFPLLLRAFRKGDIIPLKPEERGIGWDEAVWLVAMRCWQREPTNRPGAHELLEMIPCSDDCSLELKPQKVKSHAKIDYENVLNVLNEIRASPFGEEMPS